MMSLRSRLLLVLLSAVAITVLTATGATYYWARHEIDSLFDYQLRQQALALRDKAYMLGTVEAPEPDPEQHFVIQAWNWRGERIYLSHQRVTLPRSRELGYANVTSKGDEWRVYAVTLGEQLVQVAQPMAIRHRIATDAALRILYPLLVVLPALGFLIWWLVGRTLNPLAHLTRAIAARQAHALDPIAVSGLPSEARLMVNALNDLIARLQQVLARQREFMADAAHELRTPLTALRLQTQLLERATTTADRLDATAELKAGVNRSTHLVERLLTLARLEPEIASTKFHDVDITAVLRDVIRELAPIASQHGIDLKADIAEVPSFAGNEIGLRSLFTNLLDNAFRYSTAPGPVSVKLWREGTLVIASVTDKGPGIPADEQARIFDRFYRVPGANAHGSGLGLAIVKRVVELHRGEVSVADGPDDRGTTFTVRLPLTGSQRENVGEKPTDAI